MKNDINITKALIDLSTDSIFIIQNGIIKYANRDLLEFSGYNLSELIGVKFPEIVQHNELDTLYSLSLKNQNGENQPLKYESGARFKNGNCIDVEVSAVSVVFEGEPAFLVVLRDITQRKISERKYQNIIDFAPIGFYKTRRNGDFILANEELANILGYDDADELLAMNISDFYFSGDEREKLINKYDTAKSSKIKNIEIKFRKKDGSAIWVLMTARAIKDKNGNTISYDGFIIDVSEMKKSQNELIAAKEKAEESDRLKSAFLANMSHEIRTPMNGILGFTSLLLKPDLNDETKEKYIQTIHQSGERMLNTVNDIVEMSKIEAGIMEVRKSEISVSGILKDILSFFQVQAQKKGLTLNYQNKTPGAEIFVTTDRAKFESILTNLIKNAIKFTEQGSITVSHITKNGFIEFCIKDTGIGIPLNRQKAIFSRFEQADIKDKRAFEGSGLGLAIAKSYVEMLDGKIWVESTEGVGTEFYFTLPVSNVVKNSAPDSKQEHNENGLKRKYKILIVEDDRTSAIVLKTILYDIAEKITHANNGEKAIKECKNQADFDIILMDMKMPGISGHETTKRIREFNKDVIIIAQTAYALSGDREKAFQSGCNDYIAKPIKKREILEKIESNIKNCI
ncbi:PAS domain S-box protein [Draconibacterium sp.]|uniref:hybrid sensor histidine kinase/response regulator n=1 Tax=Draconibacterium sp. TaxID=1965318 RepID=UPI003563F61D